MSGLRPAVWGVLCANVCWFLLLPGLASGQTVPYERTFPQSKASIEKALKELQSQGAGRLPTLEGFASSGDRSLDRFQRGYYQCSSEVVSLPGGGTRVRVAAKITAWYADPNNSRSGYQVLSSNGRIETDFLDQLQDVLQRSASKMESSAPAKAANRRPAPEPALSAPAPHDTVPGEPILSAKSPDSTKSPFISGTPVEGFGSLESRKAVNDRHSDELTKEAKNLEEIARNQAHPNNLIAVKNSGTPILTSPVEGAKILFLASAEDEFEVLDTNANWVHIRISGLSRGWIRRTAAEIPDSSTPAMETKAESTPTQATSSPESKIPFQVENEQIASFPGSWEPLRGRTVKIISVQETKDKVGATNSQAKLDYAKSLFEREYVELTRDSTLAAGVVVVFDAEDGGMMATTLPVLQQWKAGTLSDDALWRRCYFDPPEMFHATVTR
ncbi:MAG: hypothetical protein JOZ80_02865 [Acidobacteriaceae bacterium]|nr:hypothetical protein [Acidobacteriaceae bacterium]